MARPRGLSKFLVLALVVVAACSSATWAASDTSEVESPASAPIPSPAPAPSPSSSRAEKDLAKVGEKIDDAYDKAKDGVENAFKKTKAGINRAIDWIKDDKEISESKLMAARPPAAVLKKYSAASEAATAAVKESSGTSVTVPGGATVEHPKAKGEEDKRAVGGKQLAVASSVDVTSGAELSAALSDDESGSVQSVADSLIAVVAEGAPPPQPKGPGKANATASLVNDAVADAVTEMILTTREKDEGKADGSLSRLERLGVAFGVALRESASGAEVVPRQHAPGSKPLTAPPLAIADSFVAGIQGAAVPCAADVSGPGATRNTSSWYSAVAKRCCGPVALAPLRAAQAAVDGGPDAARVALYSALSRSVDLGGPGSFSLARCSPPNAKE